MTSLSNAAPSKPGASWTAPERELAHQDRACHELAAISWCASAYARAALAESNRVTPGASTSSAGVRRGPRRRRLASAHAEGVMLTAALGLGS